jgi:type IV pilus assembly protein PilB
MKVDDHLRDLIIKNTPESVLKKKAIEQGMNTLKASGVKKILRGETTVEETLRVIL